MPPEWKKGDCGDNAVKLAVAEAAFVEFCKTQQETFRPYIHVEGETTIPNGITLLAPATTGFPFIVRIPNRGPAKHDIRIWVSPDIRS